MARKQTNTKALLGLTALAAAAAAGTYFLYGSKHAATNRTQVRGWMLRAKGEVLEGIERLKEVNQDTYEKIVDAVAEKYRKVKNVDPGELAAMVKELKGHWNNIRKQSRSGAKKLAKKRPVRKSSKKADVVAE